MALRDRAADFLQRYRLDDDRPNKETSLERLMRGALDQAGVVYEAQGRVGRFRPDFILIFGNDRVVLECDGPLHKQPAQIVKDRRKNAAYATAGMRVYRFTDTEIRRSPIGCVESILARERLVHAPESVFARTAPDATK